MVIHQAIGVDLNLPQPSDVGERVEKALPSFVFHGHYGGIGRGS